MCSHVINPSMTQLFKDVFKDMLISKTSRNESLDLLTNLTNMESFLNDVKKKVQCSLCEDTLIEPKILKCFHTFCKPCIKRHAELIKEANVFKCPKCSSETFLAELNNVDDLHSNLLDSRILKGLALVESEKVCSVSESHSPASWYCFDCDHSLCLECRNYHSFFTKDHKLVRLADLNREDFEQIIARENHCKIHPSQTLELFCKDCNTMICLTCLKQAHRDHKTITLEEFASIKRALLSKHLQVLEHLRLDEKEKQKQERIAYKIAQEGEKAIKEVKEKTKEIVEILQENERELLRQIDEKLYTAKRNLNIIHHIPAVEEYINNVMERGLASEMVNIQETECSEKFIFNSIPPYTKIAFVPNEELMKQINSGLGEIQTKRTDHEMIIIRMEFALIASKLLTQENEDCLRSSLSRTLEKGVVLSVHQGDITKENVDVIVNAANERLDHGEGVAGAIVRQDGQQIQQESDDLVRQYGYVPVGEVSWTGPGRLSCRRIFHAVSPQWSVHGEAGCRQLIFNACVNSFNIASQQKMCSIAIPGISSGVYGVPVKICAEMMFTAAEKFSCDASNSNQLKDIRFVNIDTPTCEVFRREFSKRYGMKEAPNVPQRRDTNLATHKEDKETRSKRIFSGETYYFRGRGYHKTKAKKNSKDPRIAAAAAVLRIKREEKENDAKTVETLKKKEATSVLPNKKHQECGCCFNKIGASQALTTCHSGHVVCRICFDRIQKDGQRTYACPTCQQDTTCFISQPPNGQMKSWTTEMSLLGYDGCATIFIDYEFPSGIQGPCHPNPGNPYDKLSRRTFLPDNKEGREVLELFKKAFDAGVLFTVGKSKINDKDNQIIFNADIEHKINVNGGILASGYPDPDYLNRVKAQLKAKGIE